MLGEVHVIDASPRSLRSVVTRWLAPTIIVIAAFLQVIVHVSYAEPLSPFDEYFQLDYLDKLPEQLFVPTGQEIGPYASQQLECRGIWGADYPGADCTGVSPVARPDLYENKNLADVHGPLFFAVSWLIAQPIQWLGFGDLLVSARLTNLVWLTAGALLLYGLAREMQVSRTVSAAIALLLVGAPATFWSNTFLSIDASAYAAGAGVLWLAVRYLKGISPPWMLAAAAAFAVALKFHNIAAVGVVVVGLVLAALQRDRNRGQRGAIIAWAGITAAAAVVVQVAWIAVRSASAVGARPDDGASTPFALRYLYFEAVGVLNDTVHNAFVGGTLHVAVGVPMVWLLAAGVLGMLIVRPLSSNSSLVPAPGWLRVWPPAVALLVLTVGPLFALATLLAERRFFDIPPRYGLSLLPGMLLMTGLLADRSVPAKFVLFGCGFVAVALGLAFI
jgi:hypothetical protein